jgi:hypothetical protein
MWPREGHGHTTDDNASACTCTIKGLIPNISREDLYLFLNQVLHVEVSAIKLYPPPPGAARSSALLELAKSSDIPKVNSLDGAAPSFNHGQTLSVKILRIGKGKGPDRDQPHTHTQPQPPQPQPQGYRFVLACNMFCLHTAGGPIGNLTRPEDCQLAWPPVHE